MKRGKGVLGKNPGSIFLSAMIILSCCDLRVTHAAAVPNVKWEHVHPYPTGSWLNDVAWGPPGFVAVGSDGEILHSEDGRDWQIAQVDGLERDWLSMVSFFDGNYVALGGRRLVISTNGRDWAVSDFATNIWPRAFAGGDGKWVVTADEQRLLVSTNGVDWEQRPTPVTFSRIIYGSNLWVALTGGSEVYASADLENWTQVEGGLGWGWGPVLTRLSFGNGRFVAAGAGGADRPDSYFGTFILSSSNGIDWVQSYGLDSFGETRSCAFAAGEFHALQPDGILRSTDGVSWVKTPVPPAGGRLNGIAGSDAGTLVAVGTYGSILASNDGTQWDLISANPREYIYTIAYGGGRFVAVGGDPHYIGSSGSAAALTSTDGLVWRASLTNLDNLLTGVAYGNGLWVASGGQREVFISLNATRWIHRQLPSGTPGLGRIVHGNGRFVAFPFDGDRIFRSATGLRWQGKKLKVLNQIEGVKFVNKRFFALGENGMILSSADAAKWKRSDAPTTERLSTIAFGNKRYVTGGRFVIGHSDDGKTWVTQRNAFEIYDIEFVNGWFIAVGTMDGALASRDGVEWQAVNAPFGSNWSTLAVDKNTLVIGMGFSLYRGTFE
jgi:hypothetical protein